MERRLFPTAVALAWFVLPFTALNYWRAWDRLPMRIAVHFDANWQPNGWTTREGARMLALGTTVFLLAVFTAASYAVSRAPTSSLSRWGMVVVFYIVLGLVYYVNRWIVDRSLQPPSKPFAESIVLRDLDASSAGLKRGFLAGEERILETEL